MALQNLEVQAGNLDNQPQSLATNVTLGGIGGLTGVGTMGFGGAVGGTGNEHWAIRDVFIQSCQLRDILKCCR